MRSLKVRFRAWLRGFLLKEETDALYCLLVQNALIVGTGENLVRQNGLVLKALEGLQTSLHALRDSEERHYRDARIGIVGVHERSDNALEAIAKVGDSVDRLVELVTPRAERLQGRRPVGGWDEVVADNARKMQEDTAPTQGASR
jgi:hypothetical protein